MFKLKAAQKKLLDMFVRQESGKIGLFFDIDTARRSGAFPTLTDIYDRVAAIRDGDMLYANVNCYIVDRAQALRRQP